MKVCGAILSTAALFWGFYQAPFLHIHAEDLDHAATPALVHLHVHDAPVALTPVIDALTADDDAIDLGWNGIPSSFVAFPFDFVFSEAGSVPSLVAASEPVPVPQRRGHDPPEFAPRQPRAPPA